MVLLDGVDQNTVAMVLGTHRVDDFAGVEPEHPDCLCVVWPRGNVKRETVDVKYADAEISLFLDEAIVKKLSKGSWYGKANRLSGEHGVHWDAIDHVAEASWKTTSEQRVTAISSSTSSHVSPFTAREGVSAGQIIRQRRSAVSFDGRTGISAAAFFRILQRVVPSADRPQLERPMPWDLWPHDPAIHLMIFVHRVEGLTPGLYVLARDRAKLPLIRQSLNPELVWTQPPGCPEELPLYWLLEGDARRAAAQVSCHQDIAADSAFSLGMLAEFERRLRQAGPWFYPRMFWEAGLLGQVLYLEAEAAGVRGTGIGCFFDDPVHEMLGVQGLSFQSLYHFTIGGPVEDRRMMTLPAYHHLK